MQHRVWNIVSHASIVLSGMFIVFFFIDRVNPAMDFLGSNLSKWLLLLFAVCALVNGIGSAAYLFRRKRHGRNHGEAAPYAHSAATARISERQRMQGR